MHHYTGIGSRSTPADILTIMTATALAYDTMGYTLRSGGADGADLAFENGVLSDRKEIYLPWAGFNGNNSSLITPTQAALDMAAKFHPAWGRCSFTVRKLHARNCHQVLGLDLNTPSLFVVCWTKDCAMVGGTAQALRIAEHYDIPVVNLGCDSGLLALKAILAIHTVKADG